MSVFSHPDFDSHELVVFGADAGSGLRAIIAVHDTTLGPGVGGCRMYPYASDEAALMDVLRLSRGMTYKSALAGLPLGGGKSVIVGDPRKDKSPALLRAMGAFIDSLGGRYVAAEDSGTAPADLAVMAERTRHVSGLAAQDHAGDPSPSTARGVFLGIRTAVRHRLGADSCAGLRVAIQGLGHVGFRLAALLREDGATVYGADVHAENVERARRELGLQAVDSRDILSLDVDVLAPCALGGVLNAQSIPALRAGIVAGAANNQLSTPADGARLAQRGILYCPDFLINAGGIIDVHYQRSGLDRSGLPAHIQRIQDNLEEVLRRADSEQRPTDELAEALAREYLQPGAAPLRATG